MTFVDCSTLVTDGVDIVGNWGLGCIIDIGWRALLLLVYIGTLKLTGAAVVYVGAFELAVLCCNARSVI